jgi:hypothetical protein
VGRAESALANLPRPSTRLGPFFPGGETVGAERFLVALPTSEDLFICAKDLFVGAKHGWPAQLRHREPVFIAGDRRVLDRVMAQERREWVCCGQSRGRLEGVPARVWRKLC